MGYNQMDTDSAFSSLDPLSSPLPLALVPTFSSTPNDVSVVVAKTQAISSSKETPPSHLSLLSLDAVALDKILSFLSDQDLINFHQVSHACSAALVNRPLINKRRLDLVRKIRENKENIARRIKEDNPTNDVSRINRSGHKSGTLLLVDCKNVLQSTPETPRVDNKSGSFLTPISHFSFQSFEESDKSLQSGQECGGPSPPTPILKGSLKKTTATRCRLTSRMGEEDDSTPTSPLKLEVKGDLDVIISKKLKPQTQIVSATPPLQPCSTDVPSTRALGERMSTFLVISDTSTQSCHIIDSESFESYSESDENNNNYSTSYSGNISDLSKKDGEKKGKGKGKVKKGSKDKVTSSKKFLRRIAKL